MNPLWARGAGRAALGLWLLPAVAAWAGGSGLNVAVVVNQQSSNSVALGNYYCERRLVPPQNLLRIQWSGGPVAWTRSQFESLLASPLTAWLSERGLTGQVDTVVLSMDIPYRVTDKADANSTTSVLFYGFKTNDPGVTKPCRLAPHSTNAYAGSESRFRLLTAESDSPTFLATLLTGNTLEDAMRLVDQGVGSDGSFPTQSVVLQKTSDSARNIRYFAFDNAVFDLRLNGSFPVLRTNSNPTVGFTNLLGLQTGLARLELSPQAFVPGAIADSLTSYGGLLFESSGQTNLLAFLRAGAAGSYGTVVEPCNFPQKFPDPEVYFYQARGFSLAECYYQSLRNPYEGLIVGDALAAPWAAAGNGAWLGLDSTPSLAGTTNLTLAFTARDARRPLQQIDLFVDGTLASTLTNLPPAEGNVLSATLDGWVVEYTVPPDATLASVAAGLAEQLNAQTATTFVEASAVGDRIGLEWLEAGGPATDHTISTGQAAGAANALQTFLTAERPEYLASVARAWRDFEVKGEAAPGEVLNLTVTKTSGDALTLSVTNAAQPLTAVQLTRKLLDLVNTSSALQGADGVSAEDTYPEGNTNLVFLLYARTPGLAGAQIRIGLESSAGLQCLPPGGGRLDANLGDLRARNHLYITAGALELPVTFPFDTTAYADGFHELTAIAYEGSHVRTQTRATQTVHIQNGTLAAAFACLLDGPEVAVEAELPFTVAANTSETASIELFGTGGRLAVVENQSTAAFSIPGSSLGVGRHPFYAIVTESGGGQYRSEVLTRRLVGPELSLPLTVSGPPLVLAWPGVAGRRYDVLVSGSVTGTFQVAATLTAGNGGGLSWQDPAPPVRPQFYRVRTSP